MLRQGRKTRFTPEEYLALQAGSETRAEYYNGRIYDMVGGTRDHSVIAVNVMSEFRAGLRGRNCAVFNSDMRLLVKASGLYTYPDAMVVCGKLEYQPNRRDVVTNPLLVVEVLSESTRAYDRGAKFGFYKQIPSLQEYLLIDSEQAHVECLRRTAEDQWTIEIVEGLDAEIGLASVDCVLPLSEIYYLVSWAD